MKDEHNVILILVSSSKFNSLFRRFIKILDFICSSFFPEFQVFSYPLRERSFSSPWCSHSNQWLPLVAVCHLIMLRCYHKPTTSLFFSLLAFQQLRSILLRKDALKNSFMVGDVGFILCSIYSNYLTIMHCFRRRCDFALFDQSSCFCQDHIIFPFLSV